MKILFDTNVLVRAATRPDGTAYAAVLLTMESGHVPVGSTFLFDEVQRVLDYPRVQALIRSTEAERIAFFEILRTATEFHEPPSFESIITTDPDDEPIAALAIVSGVHVLCTLDRHFHNPNAKQILESHGIRILTDVELLRELKGEELT